MEVKLNLNGNWLLTASRDHLCKLFDIRNLKEELQVFRGHKKEATGQWLLGKLLILTFLWWSAVLTILPSPVCLQLWPGILCTKDFLPVEGPMALCSSGMLGM